jgi:3-oxoadipate enol-lactonase/4-carboxymuconolactone decarboxylase
MPFIAANQLRMFYRLEGNEGLPVLILSHSIGCDHAIWDQQVPELLPYFRVLRYDIRGHGATDVSPGDYSIEQLGRDVLALADGLKIGNFAFCGLSLGGAIGQWLGVHAGDRVKSLILANTSPRFGTPQGWQSRIDAVSSGGMAGIAEMVMQRFFSAESIAGRSASVANIRSVFLGTQPEGYIGCCAALRDFDFTGKLSQIKVSSLVIVGEKDVSTPWAGNGEILAREIPGAQALRLPAAHLSNLESPRAFLAALFSFLWTRPSSKEEVFAAGMNVRRSVLGEEHVDRAIRQTTELTADFQKLITQYAWGTIWTRPGLDHRTRRLLVLAITAALGRWEEFRLHLNAGLSSDLEMADIQETLLQTAIYAGVPAANTGFHIAQEAAEAEKRK